MPEQAENHSALMDDIYRYQRLIYDVTRKYYLLGRDQLIRDIDAAPGARVLEVACGTGRNLLAISRQYPQARLYGLDISDQMLISARSKLGHKARLAQADACNFEPEALFGEAKFDHIVLSYSLSMIPDWEGAIAEAMRHLAPGGAVHIVDFGNRERLPGWFGRMLLGWLARFHVAPRDALPEALLRVADAARAEVVQSDLFRTYAFHAQVRVPA